jgi:uncharacterized iron-regulated membrane protein
MGRALMKIKARDILFNLHLYLGVTMGIIILIMALTGSLLAYRVQMIAWAEKDIYKSSFDPGQNALNIKDITVLMKEAYPDSKMTGISLKSDPHAPLVVNMGQEKTLFVNPYTGVILGQGSAMRHFLEDVEKWHRWLSMEGSWKPIGHQIKGVANIVFVALIISGMILWWPRNWTKKTVDASLRLNNKLKGKTRSWNQHNVIGFWMAPFLLVIALTGVIMSYAWAANVLYRMTGNEPPAASKMEERPKTEQKTEKKANYDMLLEKAKAQVPDWTAISMRLPKGGNSVNISIEQKNVGATPNRSQLVVNSSSGETIKWEPASAQNEGRKLRTLARYLHTGEAGGILGQTIALLAACGAMVLVWTGLSMALIRFFPGKSRTKKA